MIFIEILLLLTTFFPLFHMIDSMMGRKEILQQEKKEHGFSILVPCYNEGICIGKSIDALLKIDYKNYEVIFIDDGSDDDTLDKLKYELVLLRIKTSGKIIYYQSMLYPNFFCITKPNTGKGLSLNTGIQFSAKEIVVTLDADSMLNDDCLKIMNRAFCDKNVVAAGGTIHIVQAKNNEYLKKQSFMKRLLIKVQALDYLKGFFVYKLSLSNQNALAIISGAFGVFRKSVLLEVGGFRKSLGEDIDITIKIQKYISGTQKRIIYLPQAGCYTECPETFHDLFRQRVRWQKGFIDCILYHSKFLLTNCLKDTMSFYLIFEALFIGLFSCLLPFVSILYLVTLFSMLTMQTIFVYQMIIIVFGLIYNITAYVVAAKYKFPYKNKLLSANLVDIFVFKPFLLVVYIYGTFAYLSNKTEWNKSKRSVVLSKNKEAA